MIHPILKPHQIRRRVPWITYPEGEGKREVLNLNTVRGKQEYQGRIFKMLHRQGFRCGLIITPECCLRNGALTLSRARFEHQDGRGMNDSHRDDRIEIPDPVTGEMVPYNHAACDECNVKKGSIRRKQLVANGSIAEQAAS